MRRGRFLWALALLCLALTACGQAAQTAETGGEVSLPSSNAAGETASPPSEEDQTTSDEASETDTEAEAISLEVLTVEAVVGWQAAEGMLAYQEDMCQGLKDALAERNCLVESVTATISTAGGYTAQALADGGVDIAILPALDFIAWEGAARAVLTSGEDPCETVAAVTLSSPQLDGAFCEALTAALTETEAGTQFLAVCRPEAVFSPASDEALQAVRDYAAELEAQDHGGAA